MAEEKQHPLDTFESPYGPLRVRLDCDARSPAENRYDLGCLAHGLGCIASATQVTLYNHGYEYSINGKRYKGLLVEVSSDVEGRLERVNYKTGQYNQFFTESAFVSVASRLRGPVLAWVNDNLAALRKLRAKRYLEAVREEMHERERYAAALETRVAHLLLTGEY